MPVRPSGYVLIETVTLDDTGPAAACIRTGCRACRISQSTRTGSWLFRIIFGGGGEFPGVKAQKFHNLGFDLIAQVDVFVQQGTHLFAALAQLFCAEGEP